MTKMKHEWFRTLIGVATVIVCGFTSKAELIAYDDLEDAVPGNLAGQTSGTGFTTEYVLGSGGSINLVTNKTLSYTNGDITMDGGTNCIFITLPNESSVAFYRALESYNEDELYMSFLFNSPSAYGNSNEDYFSFGFNSAVGEARAGVAHRRNTAVADHSFGIRHMGNNTLLNVSTVPDQTYFLVFRMRKLTPGEGNVYNELALFVNPDTVYEPEPSFIVTNNCFSAATHIAARVTSLEVGDAYFLDNLCVGTTYDAVVFPSGSPVVAKPVFSPEGGKMIAGTPVVVECDTPGATIRYTTDGSTPSSTHGMIYSEPIILTTSASIRAVAFKEEMFDSLIASAEYLAQINWVGDGSGINWSEQNNWSPVVNPAFADLVFGNTNRTTSTTVNNIVDQDITVHSLSYTNSTLFAANPAAALWHVTEIGQGQTLTVIGGPGVENALLVGGNVAKGKFSTSVKMKGGGKFVVDAPDADFLIANRGSDNNGSALLDASELDSVDVTASEILIGYEQRSSATLTLPVANTSTNRLIAKTLIVGDSKESSNGQTSYLYLGCNNEIFADYIGIAARKNSDIGWQGASGSVYFQDQTGENAPFVKIRGRDGVSRANMTVGYMGSISSNVGYHNAIGLLDFTGGTVDALIGDLLMGQHQARVYAQQSGRGNGTLNMEAGCIDALNVCLGRSIYRSQSGNATGTLNVSGGVFKTRTLSFAENRGNSKQNEGAAHGVVNVSGTGTVIVEEDVVLGTREGYADELTATIELTEDGLFAVHGNMAPGTDSAEIISTVLLSGGTLCVTNTAHDAELRIENGTLEISGGVSTIDRLVLTNTLCATRVVLGEAGDCGRIVVNSELLLGGALEVSYAEDFAPRGGESWTIVDGAGERTGAFDPELVVLPDDRLRLYYTNSGFDLLYRPLSTMFIIY
jgi:hypothetical protein